MAVAFDANATAPTVSNAVTSVTTSALTVGVTANMVLLVALGFSSTSISALAVTWDNGGTNQVVTSIVAANSTQPTRSVLSGLVAPTSGAKQLKAAWTGSSDVIINATSFSGADQTGGVTTFPHSNSASGASTAPAVTITSAVGNFTISTLSEDASVINSVGNTQTFLSNAGNNVSAAGQRATGAATVSHTGVLSAGSPPWVIVGCDILAFTAATDNQEWLGRMAAQRPLDTRNVAY